MKLIYLWIWGYMLLFGSRPSAPSSFKNSQMSDLIAGGRRIFDDDEPIRKVTDVFWRITDEHEYRIGISETPERRAMARIQIDQSCQQPLLT